jgi:hypothetical protein
MQQIRKHGQQSETINYINSDINSYIEYCLNNNKVTLDQICDVFEFSPEHEYQELTEFICDTCGEPDKSIEKCFELIAEDNRFNLIIYLIDKKNKK